MSNLLKSLWVTLFMAIISGNTFAQISYYYGEISNGKLKASTNDPSYYYKTSDIRMKTLVHFKVSGDSLQISEQLKEIVELKKKGLLRHISVIEYKDCNGVKHLDPLLKNFEYLSTLIINNCHDLELKNILKYINLITEKDSINSVKDFKKAFKKKPGIYYLNSLIFRNQRFTELGAPSVNIKSFNYLEELRIENADSTGNAQQFVNDLINKWIILDTDRFLYSKFPNLKFLGFTNCGLDSIPSKLKYKQELVSLDLSRNNLIKIPECLINFKKTRSILSLNLSDNEISELSKPFLDKFVIRDDKDPKFAKYLFLSKNCLPKEELLKLKEEKYKDSFNTLTFECNPIHYEGHHHPGSLLKLAKALDSLHIALFMSGAQRAETDYNMDNKLLIECIKACPSHKLIQAKKDNSYDPNLNSPN